MTIPLPVFASLGPCMGHELTRPSELEAATQFENDPPAGAWASHMSRMFASLLRKPIHRSLPSSKRSMGQHSQGTPGAPPLAGAEAKPSLSRDTKIRAPEVG